MSRPEWKKREIDSPIYQGPRVAEWIDLKGLDELDLLNLEDILDCMDKKEFLIFEYKGSNRKVAPFVLGCSSIGKPLLRGYQIEGVSRSGKGPGWRVFQVRDMSMVSGSWEYFLPEDFKFDPFYPWTYKVLKMLGKE